MCNKPVVWEKVDKTGDSKVIRDEHGTISTCCYGVEAGEYCYYHKKIMEGLIDAEESKDRKF